MVQFMQIATMLVDATTLRQATMRHLPRSIKTVYDGRQCIDVKRNHQNIHRVIH
jgi:hypothetical protein